MLCSETARETDIGNMSVDQVAEKYNWDAVPDE